MKGIHHIAIICSDYERSKEFYLSLPIARVVSEVYRKERLSYKLNIAIGDGEIELFSFPDSPPRPSYPEACGLRHLAFAVENIEESISYLNARGVRTEAVREDGITGKRFTFFEDPDGLPLELYES